MLRREMNWSPGVRGLIPKRIPALERARHDRGERVRSAAAKALRKIRGKEAGK
jgi:hypothetical protein